MQIILAGRIQIWIRIHNNAEMCRYRIYIYSYQYNYKTCLFSADWVETHPEPVEAIEEPVEAIEDPGETNEVGEEAAEAADDNAGEGAENNDAGPHHVQQEAGTKRRRCVSCYKAAGSRKEAQKVMSLY
jgi:hypothetical protein